jgi:hypothetical protein
MAIFGLFGKASRTGARRRSALRTRPSLETLESRVVPAIAMSGNAWPSPQLITLSFMPDGTLISAGSTGNVTSDLFATMNARVPTATWQDAIIAAAQTWAQQANLNFSVIPDNGTPAGQGNYQQGDPGMGDIRIGAYNLGSGYLAGTYMPPPADNYSIAGDMSFSDQQKFNAGLTYDIQTVALHELGHALGLLHSTSYSAVMWPSYGGLKRTLTTDDINNVQAIYGARQPSANNNFLSALSLTSLINPTSLVAQATSLSINSTSDANYFSFLAPAGTASTVTVNVQSAGLSLFRPAVTVYAADQVTVLGSASGTSNDYNGDTLSVPLQGITPLQLFYVKVTGADKTAFGTGAYALTVNFGSGALPAVVPPNTQLLNGAVLQGGGAQPLKSHQQTVESWFQLFAGRPASAVELQHWGNLLNSRSEGAVLAGVLDAIFGPQAGGGKVGVLDAAGRALFGRQLTPQEVGSLKRLLDSDGGKAALAALVNARVRHGRVAGLSGHQPFNLPADQPLAQALEQLVHEFAAGKQ